MDSIDSEAKDSVLLTIRVMFIFSVILILIGLVLVDSEDSSSNSYFYSLSLSDLLGPWVLFVGAVIFLQTGTIISFRFLKSLLMKRS
mgnify:CR=1 FL=1